jgi:diketogulonate reductase-like aldo/keto reductase
MKTVTFPDGSSAPALGLGTWHMGESKAKRATEVAAVVSALDMGYRLIDTAEMYGEGGAEEVVGLALADAGVASSSASSSTSSASSLSTSLSSSTTASASPSPLTRESLFVVSKVYPHNATRSGVIGACERSLKRLKLDYLDLYLLHWPGQHPIADTIAGFETLRERGLIKRWGVSNFDIGDTADLWRAPKGEHCAANQVYYSLSERGVEFDLQPWLAKKRVPLMAYSPIDQGTLVNMKSLQALAARLSAVRKTTPAQIALAWLMRSGAVMVIPKAVSRDHLQENLDAGDTELDAATLAELDRLFPPPSQRESLAML